MWCQKQKSNMAATLKGFYCIFYNLLPYSYGDHHPDLEFPLTSNIYVFWICLDFVGIERDLYNPDWPCTSIAKK